jgi:hypothetical protein
MTYSVPLTTIGDDIAKVLRFGEDQSGLQAESPHPAAAYACTAWLYDAVYTMPFATTGEAPWVAKVVSVVIHRAGHGVVHAAGYAARRPSSYATYTTPFATAGDEPIASTGSVIHSGEHGLPHRVGNANSLPLFEPM